MLVLSRQRDESIMIGDDVEIIIVDVRGDKVRKGSSRAAGERIPDDTALQGVLKSSESITKQNSPQTFSRALLYILFSTFIKQQYPPHSQYCNGIFMPVQVLWQAADSGLLAG